MPNGRQKIQASGVAVAEICEVKARDMRILHILDHSIPLQSGYTFRTLSLLTEQRKLGWETFHLTSSKHYISGEPIENIDGFKFYRSPCNSGITSRTPVINQLAVVTSLRRRLLEIVDTINPDIIHVHSPALNGIAALSVARRKNIPLVYEVRALWEDGAIVHGSGSTFGLKYQLSRAMETYVLKQANAVTTICDGLRSEIIGRGVPADKVTVIPNAVDVCRFSAGKVPDQKLIKSLGLTGKKVLGFIGSFYKYEGLDILLNAIPHIQKKIPNVCLLLVGGGPEEDNLRAKVEQMGLKEAVFFTGRVPHENVGDYYAVVDLLVYPRIRNRVTELVTPLKPLEAMAQGKLLLASDVGGQKELINDGETGVLFRADDVHSLASAAIAILENPEAGNNIRKLARNFVESERTWTASVSRYKNVYGSVLGT